MTEVDHALERFCAEALSQGDLAGFEAEFRASAEMTPEEVAIGERVIAMARRMRRDLLRRRVEADLVELRRLAEPAHAAAIEQMLELARVMSEEASR